MRCDAMLGAGLGSAAGAVTSAGSSTAAAVMGVDLRRMGRQITMAVDDPLAAFDLRLARTAAAPDGVPAHHRPALQKASIALQTEADFSSAEVAVLLVALCAPLLLGTRERTRVLAARSSPRHTRAHLTSTAALAGTACSSPRRKPWSTHRPRGRSCARTRRRSRRAPRCRHSIA